MMTELPLKTDLVIWLPLTESQKIIYQFLVENQDLQKIVEKRQIHSAFHILTYIKKLCLHPYLVLAASIKKRYNIGLLSPEETKIIEI